MIGLLVLEVTTLPTEPQPLHKNSLLENAENNRKESRDVLYLNEIGRTFLVLYTPG